MGGRATSGGAPAAKSEQADHEINAIIKTDCNARGSHIADCDNVKDVDGKVLVNYNHSDAEKPIYLAERVAKVRALKERT